MKEDDNRLRDHEYEMEYTKKDKTKRVSLTDNVQYSASYLVVILCENSLILPVDIIWRRMNEHVRIKINCLCDHVI